MSSRMIRRSLATLLLMFAGEVAMAQGTRPRSATGSDAGETRDMQDRLDRLANRLGLTRRLMGSLARQVGLGNPSFTDAQFFAAVESTAGRARALLDENRRLSNELRSLRDPAIRDPALALLRQARTALDEGRLEDAEALYGQLATSRWGESAEALMATTSAIRSQAEAAELQGSEADFERADRIRSNGALNLVALENLVAQERILLNIERIESSLREGETLYRRRGLDRAIRIFRDEFSSITSSEPRLAKWLPAHVAYTRALLIAGQREGGEGGRSLLSTGLRHLIEFSEENANLNFNSMPLQLRLLFVEIAFERLSLIDARQIESEMTTGEFSEATRMAMNSVSFGNGISVSDINSEQVELLLSFTRSVIPFLEREDITDALTGQGRIDLTGQVRIDTSEFRSTMGMIGFMSATIIFGVSTDGDQIFGVTTDAAQFPLLIDQFTDLDKWCDTMLMISSIFIRQADDQIVLRGLSRFGLNIDSRTILDSSARVISSVENALQNNGSDAQNAEIYHLKGLLYLERIKLNLETNSLESLEVSIRNLEMALELRPLDQVPILWASTALILSDAERMFFEINVPKRCDYLRRAMTHANGAIDILSHRRPRSTINSIRNYVRSLELSAVQECEHPAGS